MKKKKTALFFVCVLLLLITGCSTNSKVTIKTKKPSKEYQGTWYAKTNDNEFFEVTVKKDKILITDGENKETYDYKQPQKGKVNGQAYYLLEIVNGNTCTLVANKDDKKKMNVIHPQSEKDVTVGDSMAELSRDTPKEFALKKENTKIATTKISNESKEGTIVNDLLKTADTLTSIQQENYAVVVAKRAGKVTDEDKTELDSKTIYKDKKIEAIWVKSNKNDEEQNEGYMKDNEFYLKQGSEWVKQKNPGDLNMKASYFEGCQILADTYKDLEMKEDDAEIIFSFKGASEEMYRRIQPMFSLEVTGVEPKDIQLDLMYVVDKKSHYLKKTVHIVDFGLGDDVVNIHADANYSNCNEELAIP